MIPFRAGLRTLRIILLCTTCMMSLASIAQRPTRYVPGDSVLFWDATDRAIIAPSLVYATDDRTVYVLHHINSYARVSLPCGISFSIDQLVSTREGLKLRILDVAPSESAVSLCIREPHQPYTLYFNGHETDFPIQNGYISIRRTWYPQDEVWIDLQQ